MLDLIIKNGQCYINGKLEDNDIAVKNGKIIYINQKETHTTPVKMAETHWTFKKNTLTRTVIWDDDTVKSSKARGHDLKKLDVETIPIISATSEFIVTIDGDWEYTSNIKTGYIQLFNKKHKKSYGGKQCKTN